MLDLRGLVMIEQEEKKGLQKKLQNVENEREFPVAIFVICASNYFYIILYVANYVFLTI
jgi:hypothetical protein